MKFLYKSFSDSGLLDAVNAALDGEWQLPVENSGRTYGLYRIDAPCPVLVTV